ncbi:LLM class flavin-dependent oxidoreductase [Bacillaceae bacterium Marseille-Q3522]|nr:LLM class flavin-dependent oxidoreductase [Bacillaceae bacterium Marseille-Q3522]
MKLSILDQAPISANQSAKDALAASMKLAQAGEAFGYSRFWIAEHHDLLGLACSAPEVVLSWIGANTNRIRIGSGAVLLPHYRPYKVAEVYNTLAVLFPGRIDVGIGRAPGGSAEATEALSNNFLQQVWNMPSLVKELLNFFDDTFTPENKYAKLSASPLPETAPVPWLLGTGKKSALLAAEYGLSYAFGQFMSGNDGKAIIQHYLENFKPRKDAQTPYVIVTVSAFCAETTEKAEEMALSSFIWGLRREKGERKPYVPSIEEAKRYKLSKDEKAKWEQKKQKLIIGNPQDVKKKLEALQTQYQADELMIVTITYSPKDKIRSYELIANEVFAQ